MGRESESFDKTNDTQRGARYLTIFSRTLYADVLGCLRRKEKVGSVKTKYKSRTIIKRLTHFECSKCSALDALPYNNIKTSARLVYNTQITIHVGFTTGHNQYNIKEPLSP